MKSKQQKSESSREELENQLQQANAKIAELNALLEESNYAIEAKNANERHMLAKKKRKQIVQQRKEKEAEQAEGSVSVNVQFYVPVKEKAQAKRKSVIKHPKDDKLLYPAKPVNLVMPKSEMMLLPEIGFKGSKKYNQIVRGIKKYKDAALAYDNLESGLEAIKLEEQGDATPVKVSKDHDAKTPLAEDTTLSSVFNQYITNNSIFMPKSEAPSVNVAFKKNSCLSTLRGWPKLKKKLGNGRTDESRPRTESVRNLLPDAQDIRNSIFS
jgi:hypothetical protein